jgi:hypothetical protein
MAKKKAVAKKTPKADEEPKRRLVHRDGRTEPEDGPVKRTRRILTFATAKGEEREQTFDVPSGPELDALTEAEMLRRARGRTAIAVRDETYITG